MQEAIDLPETCEPQEAMVILACSVLIRPTPQAAIPFRALADEWVRQTAGFPRVKDRIEHPLYLQIISCGYDALPYIFVELKKEEPDHWFEALYRITGNDPVPPKSRGNLREMTN